MAAALMGGHEKPKGGRHAAKKQAWKVCTRCNGAGHTTDVSRGKAVKTKCWACGGKGKIPA